MDQPGQHFSLHWKKYGVFGRDWKVSFVQRLQCVYSISTSTKDVQGTGHPNHVTHVIHYVGFLPGNIHQYPE